MNCNHPNGLITLTDAKVRAILKVEAHPTLYAIEGSPFICRPCGCPDAPDLADLSNVYYPLLSEQAREMVGMEDS